MVKTLALALAKQHSKESGPKSYGFGPGVHVSVNPLLLGGVLMPAKKKEADSGSTHVAQLRTKESFKEASGSASRSGSFKISTQFKEAGTEKSKSHKYRVCLIQEGLGNLGDCFFYSRGSLQDAAASGLFEGAQCFADHPSKIEESTRPERSTRDILGYFQEVRFEETQGLGALMGTLVVSEAMSSEWANSLLTNSLEYAKKFKESDFVGLSINASGEADVAQLDEFMKTELPKSVIPKLLLAKEQGVSEIRVVSKLTEAVSCDLVTKAGAGGKILKMLEGKRNVMEGEKKEMEKKEAGQVDPADAEQDKNLIAQMIKKHLGKDEASDEEMEMANHAVEAYQADGMEKQEAVEAAGKHLKMALAIGQKMSAKKEGATEEAKTESTEKKEETQEASEKKEDDKKEEHKESERVIKLTAENARLREALKAFELGDYLEKKLIGSKKPVPVTKKFREALGALKSKEQIDSSYQLFFAAYDAKSEDAEESSGFVFTEKNTQRQSKQTTESGSGFADCLSK